MTNIDFESTLEKKLTEQLATTLVEHRGRLIEDAITHMIGDDWCITDITGRGAFITLPDKTEIFSFDGVNLIHFYHLYTKIDNSNDMIGLNMEATQDYKLLYDDGEHVNDGCANE